MGVAFHIYGGCALWHRGGFFTTKNTKDMKKEAEEWGAGSLPVSGGMTDARRGRASDGGLVIRRTHEFRCPEPGR